MKNKKRDARIAAALKKTTLSAALASVVLVAAPALAKAPVLSPVKPPIVAKKRRALMVPADMVLPGIYTTQTPSAAAPTNPIANIRLWVDQNSASYHQMLSWNGPDPARAAALNKIASQPVARWFGDWNGDILSAVDGYVTMVSNTFAVPVVVAYNIPGRDCGQYSAGGAASDAAYRAWIQAFNAGIAGRRVVVILEPDALATACVTDARMALMGEAVRTLKHNKNATVYIDAGHANWIDAPTMAGRLTAADVATADGFALNVSNFYTTAENIAFGSALSPLINKKHYVIDTSRNGKGWNGEWCNPSSRSIGVAPLTDPGDPLVDGLLWIKPPGESDGECNGGPSAGTWWLDYAMGLVQ